MTLNLLWYLCLCCVRIKESWEFILSLFAAFFFLTNRFSRTHELFGHHCRVAEAILPPFACKCVVLGLSQMASSKSVQALKSFVGRKPPAIASR